MKMLAFPYRSVCWRTVLGLALPLASPAQTTSSVYYMCPGNVFTNTLTAKEADAKGCKAREARQPTTISGPKPRPVLPAPGSSSPTKPGESHIDASEQRARDSDARRILEAELRKEESALDALKREYNNGEPERHGDERNGQKYLDRVAEIKAALERKEADVNAIRRELAKLPGG